MRSEVVTLVEEAISWRRSEIIDTFATLGPVSNGMVVKVANIEFDSTLYRAVAALSSSEGIDVTMFTIGDKSLATLAIEDINDSKISGLAELFDTLPAEIGDNVRVEFVLDSALGWQSPEAETIFIKNRIDDLQERLESLSPE